MNPVDPKGTRLPIKIDSTSNGEYPPIPVGERNLEANRVALERATENAKRLSIYPPSLSGVRRGRGEHAPGLQ